MPKLALLPSAAGVDVSVLGDNESVVVTGSYRCEMLIIDLDANLEYSSVFHTCNEVMKLEKKIEPMAKGRATRWT